MPAHVPYDAASSVKEAGNHHGNSRHAEALFNGIDDAVFVHDLDGHILDANPAACRRLGYTREELLRLTTRDVDDPEFAEGFEERLQQQLTTGRLSCEGRHLTKDGRSVPVDINSSVIEIDGKPAVLAVMRDLSPRKAAERRQAVLYSVTRLLAHSGSLREAAPKILQAFCEGVGWELGVLWGVDKSAMVLRCTDLWQDPGLNSDELATTIRQLALDPGAGLAGRVWGSGTPAWVIDVADEPNFPKTQAALKAGLHRAVAFPIYSKNALTAVIEFFGRERGCPDEDVLTLMTALASQVGQYITRRRAEEDRDRFFTLALDMLCIAGFDGYFQRLNPAWQRTLGFSDEELLARPYLEFVHPDDRALTLAEAERVSAGANTIAFENRYLCKDGSYKWLSWRGVPYPEEQMIYAVAYDVTERKALDESRRLYTEAQERYARETAAKNQALAESEKRYRQLTEATLDGIVVADERGNITLFNPAAERLFGYTAAEACGQSLTLIIPESYRAGHQRGFQRFLQSRLPRIVGQTLELHGRRKDGTDFPLELALNVMDLGDELLFLGAVRDLTERNRMRAHLVQNEKLASIGLLSAGVAHEINNPLAFVANNLAVLERDHLGLLDLVKTYHGAHAQLAQVDPDSARRAEAIAEDLDLEYVVDNLQRVLNRTRDGVNRVTRIVQSLRGLARTDRPDREETAIPDLVDNCLEMIRGRLKRRNIEVELAYDYPGKVRCVASQINQVLLNLLVNALQAIEAGGRPEGKIRVATRREGDGVVLEVADTGCGIAPDHRSRLFDPFFTTKDVGEGTGLGLSISHNIVTGHGGRIEVESEVGQGTRFLVHLPLNPPREPA